MLIPKEQLDALCKERGMTIKQLEREAGIGNGVIGQWYKRGTSPSHDRLEKIAEVLSVSIEYLTGKAEQPTNQGGLSPDTQHIAELIERLPPGLRKTIRTQLEALVQSLETPGESPGSP